MQEIKTTYTEVLGVLLALGNEYVEKIPSKVMQFLMENCDFTNIPKFDQNLRLEEQDISDDARNFLIMLKLKYWCNSKEEKEEIYKILKDNDKQYEKELKEKYNTDELFENTVAKTKNENVGMANIEKEKWYQKIFYIIKNLFKRE